MSRHKNIGDAITIKGFFRVQIQDKKSRKIVGDTGWMQNQITNYGFESCIVALPFKCANTVQCTGMLLGSGSVPASDAADIPNSHTAYWSSFGQSTVIGSSTCRATQSFDGTLGAVTLSNIGVYANSTDPLIAGNTYASSALATTQDVNATYELRYS